MCRKSTRLLSMFLALVMLFSITPLQLFAEWSEPPNDKTIIPSAAESLEGKGDVNSESLSPSDGQTVLLPADESLDGEGEVNSEPLSLPDGQTIILPIDESSEGEENNFPKEEKKGNGLMGGLMSLSSTNMNTVYAPTGADSYSINDRIYLDTTTEPVSGAMLQVLASDGETVLAKTAAIEWYNEDYDTGYYYVIYEYITLLQEITAGTYSMQLVTGQEKIPALTKIEFTDQPFLGTAWLESFYEGADTCEVYVGMYNSSEKQLEQLTFSLLDSNDKIVGQTSGLYRKLNPNNNNGRQITGYTLMNINSSVSQDELYRLAITYTGAETLYDGTSGMASFSPGSSLNPEITNFEITDAQTSGLTIYVDNLEAEHSYVLTVRDCYYGKILHQSTVSGANSPFEINLTINGITVPITSFNTYEFYVEIQCLNGDISDSESFQNPYFNYSNTGNTHFYLKPCYINPNTTSLPFTLNIYNASGTYSGGTNFTISVQSIDGIELASIHGNQTTIVRDGDEYEISGTFNFSSLPKGAVDIIFNATRVCSAYVTDTLEPYGLYDRVNYNDNTFWLMMDQLNLQTDVINSSGTAKLVMKDESGSIVSESNIKAGAASEYYNHLNYEFTLTPQLINGQEYSLALVDGTKEYPIFSNWENDVQFTQYTYDGTFSFNRESDFYLSTYDASVDDTYLKGQVNLECKNMTSEYLSDFLQSIVLKNADGAINDITGYTNGRFRNSSYLFDIVLTSPLSDGCYTLTYPDGDSIYFEPYVEDTTPSIYGNDAGDGYVLGAYLPTDAAYTAKIYQGYTCLTNAPFTLTLSGAYTNDSPQRLYIPKDIIRGLNRGVYEMRVYQDGALVQGVPLTISKPLQTVVFAYDPDSSSNNLFSTTGYVSFRALGEDQYTQLKFSEDFEQLNSKEYDTLINNRYELSSGDGEKTLYVQLKDNAGNESEVIFLTIYRLEDDSIPFYIPLNQMGVHEGDDVTLLVGADMQYLDAYVDFIDADEVLIGTAQLDYMGLGKLPPFGGVSGSSDELKHIYGAKFFPEGYNNNIRWNDDYFEPGESRSLVGTAFARYYMGTDRDGRPYPLGRLHENLLVFGSLDNIIMKQFKSSSDNNYNYGTKENSVTLNGYAMPNSTVTLVAEDGNGCGFEIEVTANKYGYFSHNEEGIAEGEYTFTATDSNGLSLKQGRIYTLIVDRTKPTISSLKFTYIDSKNIEVQWTCLDTDVDLYAISVNDLLWLIEEPGTEYKRKILASNDDLLTLFAIDSRANITHIRKIINVKPPTPVNAGGGGIPSVNLTIPTGSGVSLNYMMSGGTITLAIPDSKITEIIKNAKDGTAVINASEVSGATDSAIPKSALTKFANSELDVEIHLPHGTVILDAAAAKSAAAAASGSSITISAKEVDTSFLTTRQKAAINPNDLVLDVSVISGTQAIHNFEGTITVTVPYDGELPVAVWHLKDRGQLEEMPCTYDKATKTVTFTTNHLSLYVVGRDTRKLPDQVWENPFSDIKSTDWFYGDVGYVFTNGLMLGTSTNPMVFSPNVTLTRGMVVTVLYRIAGSPDVSSLKNQFNDVDTDKWYNDAIKWAASNGIVSGYGEGKFGTEDNITREQMAVMIINYQQFSKKTPLDVIKDKEFVDNNEISGWAKDAVNRLAMQGIITGKPGNLIDPQGEATRTEFGAMLHRFLESVK